MWGFLVVLMMVLIETEERDVGESLSVGESWRLQFVVSPEMT